MKKRILSISPVLIFCLMLSMPEASAQTEIRTAEEFAAIAGNNSDESSYILMNDLTVDNWIPVGSIDGDTENGFNGTFDGNGHTVTVNGFAQESDNTHVGLFGLIGKKGTVKNLRVAGKVNYTGGQKFLYIGGIAGFNSGLITCCVSSVNLTCNYVKSETKTKVKHQFGYEAGQYGGGIAGINLGTISHCYSNGSIRVLHGHAAGIAAGNGKPIGGSIGFSIGSGGGGISVSPGAAPKEIFSIRYCYSTASVSSAVDNIGKAIKDLIFGGAGGIVATNRQETAELIHCVALNRLLEAKGKNMKASPFPVGLLAATGISHPNFQFYFREDIVVRLYDDWNTELKPAKISPKRAVPLSLTQEESWWRMPEGLTKKEQKKVLGFPFGNDETSPWKWSDNRKQPVLYWETDTPEEVKNVLLKDEPEPLQSAFETDGIVAATETESKIKQLTPDITWTVNEGTLIISGTGKMPNVLTKSPWNDARNSFTSVVIEDGITVVGSHSFFGLDNITSIVFGENVANIKIAALSRCKNLAQVEVKSAVPPKIGSTSIVAVPVDKATLIVPAGAKAAYENDKVWKKFGTIEEK